LLELFIDYGFKTVYSFEHRLTQAIGLRSEKYSIEIHREMGVGLSVGRHNAVFHGETDKSVNDLQWYPLELVQTYFQQLEYDWEREILSFNRNSLIKLSGELEPIIRDVFELIDNKEKAQEFHRYRADQRQLFIENEQLKRGN